MTKENFDEVNEILKENANTTSFIKDYILRFRFADIALNSIYNAGNGQSSGTSTTSEMVKRYLSDANKLIEKYEDKVEKICSSTNIKVKCEADDMMSLKKELDNEKKKNFKKIIDQYNSTSLYGNHSGTVNEYMLYDMYAEYISSEEFVYDENNPYVVELYYHITTFLQIRERLEYNGSNINHLVIKFQEMCDKVLRKYWDDSMYDYYGRLKDMFKYDFYSTGDDIVEAYINDTQRVTLYSKVLEYLRNITKYTAPKSSEEKYKGMSIDDLMKGREISDTKEEKRMKELEKSLKKISISFVQLRRIESEIDQKYFSEYIPEDDSYDILTMKDNLGEMSLSEQMSEYMSALSAPPQQQSESAISAMASALQIYVAPLLKLTRNESRILRDLSNRAISWYEKNEDNIQSGKIFEKMLEVNWPNPSTIYKDGIKHDFYFLEEPKTISEQLETPEMNGGSQETEDDYSYIENSMKTKMDVLSFGYWVKYCTIATMVNCMLPMYWSTGLIVAGAPVSLPIIYIPIIAIQGRVTLVIGLGICGICPLPMLLYINFGNIDGSLIPPINNIVDMLRKLPSLMMKLGELPVKGIIKGLIEAEDNKINRFESEKRELQMKIKNLDNGVKIDRHVLTDLKKMRGDNPTIHAN